MIIPKKMKLNQFKVVRIPENKDYFARYGASAMPESAYSGDNSSPMFADKIDNLAKGLEDYQQFCDEEAEKASK